MRWLGLAMGSNRLIPTKSVRVACFAGRYLFKATINGSDFARAKPEEEAGFFDNFELTK